MVNPDFLIFQLYPENTFFINWFTYNTCFPVWKNYNTVTYIIFIPKFFLLLLYFMGAGYYVLAGFLGVMGLKAGAYLQPLTHKFYNWLFHETDPVPQPLIEEGETASENIEE